MTTSSFFSSNWCALVLCFLFGAFSVFLSNPRGGRAMFTAIVIAVCNSLLLLGGVLGIDQAATQVLT